MRICRRIRFWLPAMSSRAGKRCGRRSIYPLPRHGRTLRQIILRGWRSWQRDLQTTIRCPVPPPMRYFSIILRNRIKSWSVWKAWKA